MREQDSLSVRTSLRRGSIYVCEYILWTALIKFNYTFRYACDCSLFTPMSIILSAPNLMHFPVITHTIHWWVCPAGITCAHGPATATHFLIANQLCARRAFFSAHVHRSLVDLANAHRGESSQWIHIVSVRRVNVA